jgi:uncharacterized glyoxalase superfamily protein PhnB
LSEAHQRQAVHNVKMDETFFAHRFGQLRDKFGVNWMAIHEKPMQRPI